MPNSKIAYILRNSQGEPYSPNATSAAQGFAHLGYEIRHFTRAELASLPLSPSTVVVGGMGTMHAAFEAMGVPPPMNVTVPACLYPFLGREAWRTSLAELQATDRYPVFVKPYEDSKIFTGKVVRNRDELDALVMSKPGVPALGGDFPLLCQTPVQFVSEWRAFVVRGRVIGVSNYQGDPLVFPNAQRMRHAIGSYVQAPAGFSADFGVLVTGETVLVEVNDGYALGNGGLLGSLYAELLRARWEEIVDGCTIGVLKTAKKGS